MADFIFYQGDDISQDIEAKDRDGIDIDIDSLTDFIVHVVPNGRKEPFVAFNKTGSGSYLALMRKTAFIYTMLIPKETTAIMPIGNIYYEPRIDGVTDVSARAEAFELRPITTKNL